MEKDIDITGLYLCFLRHKLKIILLTFFAGTLGAIYSLTLPRIWEGSFEIVMRNSNEGSEKMSQTKSISELINNETSTDSTELEILRSPLVLTSVYDHYKSLKKEEDPSVEDDWED